MSATIFAKEKSNHWLQKSYVPLTTPHDPHHRGHRGGNKSMVSHCWCRWRRTRKRSGGARWIRHGGWLVSPTLKHSSHIISLMFVVASPFLWNTWHACDHTPLSLFETLHFSHLHAEFHGCPTVGSQRPACSLGGLRGSCMQRDNESDLCRAPLIAKSRRGFACFATCGDPWSQTGLNDTFNTLDDNYFVIIKKN